MKYETVLGIILILYICGFICVKSLKKIYQIHQTVHGDYPSLGHWTLGDFVSLYLSVF